MTSKPRVLVTGGRMPVATGLVRALHAAGAEVDAADAYRLAAALHSNAVEELHVVAPTASEPIQFIRDVAAIVRERKIDLIVPTFEEGFFLSNYASQIPAPVFAPEFATIERLHNKVRFLDICDELGIPTPKTIVARSHDELSDAIAAFETYLARPAFSRGGAHLLTNHGTRPGTAAVEDFAPTSVNPWIVQEFIEGTDACSMSIVRDGRVVVHCTYEPVIAAAGGWSIKFQSIDDFGGKAIVEELCERFSFNGCISFDFRRTPDGRFVMIECNPRASAGIFLIPPECAGEAMFGDPGGSMTVAAGQDVQYDVDIVDRSIVRLRASELVRTLLKTPDAFFKPGDMMPALCFLIGSYHWAHVAEREHIDVSTAYVGDVSWDGAPMPEIGSA